MAFRLSQLLFLVGITVGIISAPLMAAPLEKEACDQLQTEKQSLTQQGVEKDMEKGPEWAKANLQPTRLELVKRYISVNEQIKFRCTPVVEPKPITTADKKPTKDKKKGAKAEVADAEKAASTGVNQKNATATTKQLVKPQAQPAKSPKKTEATRSVNTVIEKPVSEGE